MDKSPINLQGQVMKKGQQRTREVDSISGDSIRVEDELAYWNKLNPKHMQKELPMKRKCIHSTDTLECLMITEVLST